VPSPLLALLAVAAAPLQEPLSFERHVFLGEHLERAEVRAEPLSVPGQAVLVSPHELATWRGENADEPRVEGGRLFSFRCEEGGRWVSPPDFSLNSALIDELRFGYDNGHASEHRYGKGTWFFLDWKARDGDEIRVGTKDLVLPGRGVERELVIDFGAHEAWQGEIHDFAIRPVVEGESRVQLQALSFRGLFGELAAQGSGWRDVLIDFHEQDATFTTVPGSVEWQVDVPAGTRLYFDAGIVGPGARARFRVTATSGGLRAVLFDEVVAQEDGWQARRVSLEPFAGRTVELLLEAAAVEDSPPAVACWADPTLRAGYRRNQPNVFFYLADTLRADHLPLYGYGAAKTPFLDLLAKRSVVFDDCVSQGNWTKSSMPSIMTSTYVSRHRVTLDRNGPSSRIASPGARRGSTAASRRSSMPARRPTAAPTRSARCPTRCCRGSNATATSRCSSTCTPASPTTRTSRAIAAGSRPRTRARSTAPTSWMPRARPRKSPRSCRSTTARSRSWTARSGVS